MPSSQKRLYCAVVAGNVLDHYSTALYGFLVPLLAPLYFPNQDPAWGLVVGYGVLAMGVLTRPLGAVLFGHAVLRWGPRQILCVALLGMACSTFLMGLMPTHAQWGVLASFGWVGLKMLQGFFAAGERSVGSVYALRLLPEQRRVLGSSVYQSATMLGILMASAAVASLPLLEAVGLGWRFLFLLGGVLGGLALLFRTQQMFEASPEQALPWSALWGRVRERPQVFVRAVVVSGFSYITYVVPFVFMNALAALLAIEPYLDVLAYSTLLMVADMLLLPLLGLWTHRQDCWAMMRWAAWGLFVGTGVLFPLFESGGTWALLCFNGLFVVLGLLFLVPLKVWLLEVMGARDAYVFGGLAFALGSELIGKTLPMAALMLHAWSGHLMMPAAYIMFWCALAAWAVGRSPQAV